MFTETQNEIPSGFKGLHEKISALALKFLEYLLSHSLEEAEGEWLLEKEPLWDVQASYPISLMQGKGYMEAGGGVGVTEIRKGWRTRHKGKCLVKTLPAPLMSIVRVC